MFTRIDISNLDGNKVKCLVFNKTVILLTLVRCELSKIIRLVAVCCFLWVSPSSHKKFEEVLLRPRFVLGLFLFLGNFQLLLKRISLYQTETDP